MIGLKYIADHAASISLHLDDRGDYVITIKDEGTTAELWLDREQVRQIMSAFGTVLRWTDRKARRS